MRCKCCDVVLTGSEIGRKRKVVEYGKEYWFEDGFCNRCGCIFPSKRLSRTPVGTLD